MATVDPREKMARSRLLASAYATKSLLQSEEAIDRQVALLLGWMDDHATSGRPMDLSRFFTFIAYDLMGEFAHPSPFPGACPFRGARARRRRGPAPGWTGNGGALHPPISSPPRTPCGSRNQASTETRAVIG